MSSVAREPTNKGKLLLQLGAVLLVALLLRGYHLGELIPAHPQLTADGVEYREYGLHLVQSDYPKPIADRPPGFPIILGVMYSLVDVPADQAYPQRLLSTFFDLGVIALAFFVAARVGGGAAGTICGLLMALNGEMIRDSALAGTEQLYSAMQLGLFLLYLRLARGFDPKVYALVCLLGTWMIVTKQEGWFILAVYIAYYAIVLWRGCGFDWRIPAKLAPLFALPWAAFSWYKYYSTQVLAIPTMNYRTGNGLFFCEYLAQRMPWGYMRDLRNEYFRISNLDWLLHYHGPGRVVEIVFDSSILVVRFLAAMLSGWLMLLFAIAGLVWLLRRREVLVPIMVAVSILPFCAFAYYHSISSYTPRLLVPSLVLVVICTAVGLNWMGEWLRGRKGVPVWAGPALVAAVIAVYAGANLLRENALGVLPDVGGVSFKGEDQSTFRPPLDLDEKVALGTRMQLVGQYEESRAAARQVLDAAPQYAPAYFVLALNDMSLGKAGEAAAWLKTAREIVPFYAEAYMLLATIQLNEERYEDAILTCRACAEMRPDYPPCHYLLASLNLDYLRDYGRALYLFEHYVQLNRQAHRNYRDYLVKRLDKAEDIEEVREQIQFVDADLATDVASFLTTVSWNYLHRGKSGAYTQRIKPDDRTLHYNMALAFEQLGQGDQAIEYYEKVLQQQPRATAVGGRLQALRDRGGRVEGQTWPQLSMAPGIYRAEWLWAQGVKGYFDPQYGTVHGD